MNIIMSKEFLVETEVLYRPDPKCRWGQCTDQSLLNGLAKNFSQTGDGCNYVSTNHAHNSLLFRVTDLAAFTADLAKRNQIKCIYMKSCPRWHNNAGIRYVITRVQD